MTRIEWSGEKALRLNIAAYGEKGRRAVREVMAYWQPVIEAYAKAEAPWTDRTGNARQGLHTFVEELSRDTVALYLSHGVEYGLQLELRRGGRYAIIAPTLEAHYSQIAAMLREIFR